MVAATFAMQQLRYLLGLTRRKRSRKDIVDVPVDGGLGAGGDLQRCVDLARQHGPLAGIAVVVDDKAQHGDDVVGGAAGARRQPFAIDSGGEVHIGTSTADQSLSRHSGDIADRESLNPWLGLGTYAE